MKPPPRYRGSMGQTVYKPTFIVDSDGKLLGTYTKVPWHTKLKPPPSDRIGSKASIPSLLGVGNSIGVIPSLPFKDVPYRLDRGWACGTQAVKGWFQPKRFRGCPLAEPPNGTTKTQLLLTKLLTSRKYLGGGSNPIWDIYSSNCQSQSLLPQGFKHLEHLRQTTSIHILYTYSFICVVLAFNHLVSKLNPWKIHMKHNSLEL